MMAVGHQDRNTYNCNAEGSMIEAEEKNSEPFEFEVLEYFLVIAVTVVDCINSGQDVHRWVPREVEATNYFIQGISDRIRFMLTIELKSTLCSIFNIIVLDTSLAIWHDSNHFMEKGRVAY